MMSKILDLLYSLLPLHKPDRTCGLMLLWSLTPDKAKILVDYLDAMVEESWLGPGDDAQARRGNWQGRTGDDYLEIPDWL